VKDIDAHQEAGGQRIVSGTAIPFGELSLDLGGFVEQFQESAVDRTLRTVDVRALASHDDARLLGRVTARTLTISKDRRGLQFEILVPNTSDGRDVYELVKRRDLTGASFAFKVHKDGEHWDFTRDPPLRTVTDTTIREISLVAWPAYPQTTAHVRSGAGVTGNRIAWLEKWARTHRARCA
jgi:HK97 family phage prohead protease